MSGVDSNGKSINIIEEIKVRSRLGKQFDELVKSLTSGLNVETEEDLEALMLLVITTIETRKRAEKEEAALKEELKKHFKPGALMLQTPNVVALLTPASRTDIDRAALTRELGEDLVKRFTKTTHFSRLNVQLKVGGLE